MSETRSIEQEMKIDSSLSRHILNIRRNTPYNCIGKQLNSTLTSQICMLQCVIIDRHQDLKRYSGEVCRLGNSLAAHGR